MIIISSLLNNLSVSASHHNVVRAMHIHSSVEAGVDRAPLDEGLVHKTVQVEVDGVAAHTEGLAHVGQLNIGQMSLSNLVVNRKHLFQVLVNALMYTFLIMFLVELVFSVVFVFV